MRIKTIKPTNCYKHIEFGNIKDCWEQSKVLTPTGFNQVINFNFIKTAPTKIIKLMKSDMTLVCDLNHRLKIDNEGKIEEVFAKDLNPINHRLISYFDELCKFTIEDGPISDLYDIQLPDPHWWYTSGMISHNSILLCNTAITSLKGMGANNQLGQDVLLITCELDTIKTAMRCLGVASGIPLNQICGHKDYIIRIIEQLKETYNKRFFIYEMPPAECSVNHIYALLDNLKKNEGWKPDIIIVDYLDLLISRVPDYNKDDYSRQKHVAEELRGLAKNENALIFTATQTNRTGAKDGEVVDLTKAAESYAKQFSLDYVIGLMQSQADLRSTPPKINMFVAKNRNGPKNEVISCEINYDTMLVKELL